MLLVVIAHAAVAYGQVRIPGLIWAVRDPARTLVFEALFWCTVGLAMPAFFTLSGIFAVQTYDRRGFSGFARDRTRKIVGPLLAGGSIILPLSLAVWGLGWLISGRCTWHQLLYLKFVDEDLSHNIYGPAHLWFLEYLVLMLAAYGLLRVSRGPRASADYSAGRGWLLHPLAPLFLAVPTALILWTGHLRFGLDAVTDFRNSFLPDPFRWAHHAWFFTVGTWLSRYRNELGRFGPHWGWRLALAVPAFLVRFLLVRHDLVTPLHGASSVALAVSSALFAWLGLFGLIGLAQRCFSGPRPAVRYMADCSYWIYLVHFPFLGLVQVDLAGVPCGAAVKVAVGLGLTMTLGLASYQTLVRRTWIGHWLHGPVSSQARSETGAAVTPPCPARPLGLR